METYELMPHPTSAPARVSAIGARIVSFDANWLVLRWRIEDAGAVIVPPLAGRGRANELWTTTCFEMFVMSDGGEIYSEFNFSPSEQWAAYDFSAYRQGMSPRRIARAPVCTWRTGSAFAIFDVALASASLPPLPARIGLTAVIEEEGGIKSYWAARHASDIPDFHDRACFTGKLEAPRGI